MSFPFAKTKCVVFHQQGAVLYFIVPSLLDIKKISLQRRAKSTTFFYFTPSMRFHHTFCCDFLLFRTLIWHLWHINGCVLLLMQRTSIEWVVLQCSPWHIHIYTAKWKWLYAAQNTFECGLSNWISVHPRCVSGAFAPVLTALHL